MFKKWFVLVIAIVAVSVIVGSCSRKVANGEETEDLGNKQNPFYGKTFSSVTDIPELGLSRFYEEFSIGISTDLSEFGLHDSEDNNGNIIFVFSKRIKCADRGLVWKILDTINIGKLNENEGLVSTDLNNYFFKEDADDFYKYNDLFGIITNISYAGTTMYGEIDRVWRADINTGIISQIDVAGLGFFNDYSGRLVPPSAEMLAARAAIVINLFYDRYADISYHEYICSPHEIGKIDIFIVPTAPLKEFAFVQFYFDNDNKRVTTPMFSIAELLPEKPLHLINFSLEKPTDKKAITFTDTNGHRHFFLIGKNRNENKPYFLIRIIDYESAAQTVSLDGSSWSGWGFFWWGFLSYIQRLKLYSKIPRWKAMRILL